MSEKKLWQININYIYSCPKCDGTWEDEPDICPLCTIEATEKEVKELLETDWNPKCIENHYDGELHRHFEAVEMHVGTVDDLKKQLKERFDCPVE